MEKILESYNAVELKRMIRATNITGYSKLKKPELIKLMMRPEHRDRFKSIKRRGLRERPSGAVQRLKVTNEFKTKAKRPREKFELKEESKKIEERISKAKKGKKGSKEI